MNQIVKILAQCNSPKDFWRAIPRSLEENLEFRISLHKLLATDHKAQQVFLSMCRLYIPIIFDTTLWTINPQKKPGFRNRPFILRPAQTPAVETLNWCIDNGRDAGINKTRKQGASEICCKLFAAKALLEEDCHFIIGSRNKSLVDNYGDPTTLFAKVDNVFECLPSWWLNLCGYNPKINRKDMVLTVPATNSSFAGDTTNESFSAGSRGTAVLLDEFGRVDHSIAESIEGSVHDVAECIIYSSTHWLGENHTFNKCLKKDTTTTISLMWYQNPEEMQGLYTTEQAGSFEIIDEEYYSDKDLSSALVLDSIYKYNPNETRIQFVADGLKGVPSPYRSPWFDYQQSRRQGNKRDFHCNVCADPMGSADSPFDPAMLQEIKKRTIRPPDIEAEILFELDEYGIIDQDTIQVYYDFGERKLKFWGDLEFGRPTQRHNYIIGVDPSYGLGSANSAAVIVDRNTGEQIGAWTDSVTKPEDFADTVVALAYWLGGVTPTFIIWESNAGCGTIFGDRVIYQGYFNVYTQRREDSKTRKKTQKYGWSSGTNPKEKVLGELGVALSCGLTEDRTYTHLIIHDEYLLDELKDYIFKEKGAGIIQSSKADLSTGAQERHGDRGIAAALCVLAMKDQPVADYNDITNSPFGTFKYYMEQEELRKREELKQKRRYLY